MTTWDAARSLATWLGATLLLAVVFGLVLPRGMVAGASALGLAAGVAGAWRAGRDGVAPGRRWAAIGLPVDRTVPGQVVLGLGSGVAVAAVAVGGIAASGALEWTVTSLPVGAWIVEGGRALLWLSIPALAEEILVRGYPLRWAAGLVGPTAAVWATSGIFAALHLQNPALGPWGLATLVAAGLFLGALVLRTGSLWWAAGAHLGWNWALAFLADVPVSGLEVADAPGVAARVQGPEWLTGGGFGVEGSALAALALALGAGVVMRSRWLRNTNPVGPGVAVPPPGRDETTHRSEEDR